jgi:uncharacterized protein (UPF0212 family)
MTEQQWWTAVKAMRWCECGVKIQSGATHCPTCGNDAAYGQAR